MNSNGKVAIVTGASRGIGRQVAIQLARSGAKVAVNYSSNPAKADEVVNTIEQMGGETLAVRADISNICEIENLFSMTIESVFRQAKIPKKIVHFSPSSSWGIFFTVLS